MKTLVWDVDDVLNDLMRDWFDKKYRTTKPDSKLNYNDITGNPPDVALGIGLDEYKKSLDEFRDEYGHQFMPVPQTMEWFKNHGHKYRHIALTAVPIKSSNKSAEWVFRYFGNWIRSFNIIPSPRPSDPPHTYHTTKKDFLHWLGSANVLIDDNTHNIRGATELGMETILFPRPWNKSSQTIPEALQLLI